MSRYVVKIVIANQVLIRGKTNVIAWGFANDWIQEAFQTYFRFCKRRKTK
jgi:hypothetical protein